MLLILVLRACRTRHFLELRQYPLEIGIAIEDLQVFVMHQKHQQIRGWGFGFRLNVGDDLTCRVEVGYPLGHKTPSDSDHAHPWVEFTWKY